MGYSAKKLFYVGRGDLYFFRRLAVALRSLFSDLVEGFQTSLIDGAENVICRWQRRVFGHQEELGAVRAGTGVCHGKGATRVGQWLLGCVLGYTIEWELIIKLVAWAAGTGARWVTTLQDAHLLGLHVAVADGVVEEILLDQGFEAVDATGGGTTVELNGDIAGGRRELDLDGSGRRDALASWLFYVLGSFTVARVLAAHGLRVWLQRPLWKAGLLLVLLFGLILSLGGCFRVFVRGSGVRRGEVDATDDQRENSHGRRHHAKWGGLGLAFASFDGFVQRLQRIIATLRVGQA